MVDRGFGLEMESTYGDRFHDPEVDHLKDLVSIKMTSISQTDDISLRAES